MLVLNPLIALAVLVLTPMSLFVARFISGKTHKYFTCPNCRQKLRVPKGNGRITITCPKCKTQFKGKS